MSNKQKIIVVLLVALMGGLMFLKWKSDQQVQAVSAAGAAPAIPEAVAPLNNEAPVQTQAVESSSYPQYPAPVEVAVQEPDPDITGPSTMSRDRCLAFYKKHPRSVAFYSQLQGGDSAMNYGVCHSIASSDTSFCGFVRGPNDECVRSILNYRMLYSGAIGKMDMPLCEQFMEMVKVGPKDWTAKKMCQTTADIMSGRTSPPSFAESQFKFLSGSPAACSELRPVNKKDCVLLADVMSGVKKGSARMWLYDALSGKGCKKADDELVELYCANKITRGLAPFSIPRPPGGGHEEKSGGE